jgi:hypothetical protein
VDQIPGWDLYDEAGLDVAKNFVGRLALLSWEVTKTLCGAIRIWQKDNSLEVKFPDAADELFGEIDSVYVPLARSVFGFDSENITNDA